MVYAIYDGIEKLLTNYSLSQSERSMIETLISIPEVTKPGHTRTHSYTSSKVPSTGLLNKRVTSPGEKQLSVPSVV